MCVGYDHDDGPCITKQIVQEHNDAASSLMSETMSGTIAPPTGPPQAFGSLLPYDSNFEKMADAFAQTARQSSQIATAAHHLASSVLWPDVQAIARVMGSQVLGVLDAEVQTHTKF